MPLRRIRRKRDSLKSEKVVAGRFKGRVQPSSGSLWFRKGDFLVGRKLLGECKSVRSGSIRFKFDWMLKVERAAMFSGRYPLVVLSFYGNKEPQVVCMKYEDFEELVCGGVK